jgi:hypothetical protein
VDRKLRRDANVAHRQGVANPSQRSVVNMDSKYLVAVCVGFSERVEDNL